MRTTIVCLQVTVCGPRRDELLEVLTGLGATDDGMATVSVLQVIQAFTNPNRKGDKRIRRGLIALLNNGEEDYLVC
jgi:Zn-dependent M28 family amino/carboxypeptidase